MKPESHKQELKGRKVGEKAGAAIFWRQEERRQRQRQVRVWLWDLAASGGENLEVGSQKITNLMLRLVCVADGNSSVTEESWSQRRKVFIRDEKYT